MRRGQFINPLQVKVLTTEERKDLFTFQSLIEIPITNTALLANSDPAHLQENKSCNGKLLHAQGCYPPRLLLFFCCSALLYYRPQILLTSSFNTYREVVMSQPQPPLAHVMCPTANDTFPLARTQQQLDTVVKTGVTPPRTSLLITDHGYAYT